MIIIAPLAVRQSAKKMFNLNLNVYRNSHYLTLNRVKKLYKKAIAKQIESLPTLDRITLQFILYPKDRRLCDVSNVLSVHDKFFADALVELGKLEDDNYKFLPETRYTFGAIDKENPRVEVHITEITKEQ